MIKTSPIHTPRRNILPLLAWMVIAFGLALMATSVGLAYLGRFAELSTQWGPWYSSFISMLPFALILVISGIIIHRLPHNPFGWVFLALGFGFGVMVPFGQYYGVYGLMVANPPLPFSWEIANLFSFGFLFGLATLPLVLLLFPTGAPPGPRWQGLIGVIGLGFLFVLALGLTEGTSGIIPLENPYTLHGPIASTLNTIGYIGAVLIFAAAPLSFLSLVVRYHQGNRTVRQQMKWLVFGAALMIAFLVSDILFTFRGVWKQVIGAITFAPIPVAVGFAILRYRLYDINIIIRRTIVYSILTASLILVYSGAVTILQNLFQSLTGQSSTLAGVLSTLAIAALFNPLRNRIQDFIDRRFYRQKYNAEQALGSFSLYAQNETGFDELTRQLVKVVQETMQPEQANLWLFGKISSRETGDGNPSKS
jgi:hypothetical protein